MSAEKAVLVDPAKSAKSVQLRYVKADMPGIQRKRNGKGWTYLQKGKAVKAKDTVARIDALVLPPAWKDVWICPYPNGHLQATGIDAKGRKQYRYHTKWSKVRGTVKFDRMSALGKVLPKMRKVVDGDLRRKGMPKEKVLAGVVAIMERTRMRVGNEAYAQVNGSFGLSTLKDRHVKKDGTGTHLKFKGKSGKTHNVGLRSKPLTRLVMRCKELRGQHLFQYEDAEGDVHAVDSGMVNDYIRIATKGEFTSKDLRTWQGSACFVEAALNGEPAESRTARQSAVVGMIDEVAQQLGNTRNVCRSHYIHPRAIALAEADKLQQLAEGLRESRNRYALSLAEKVLMKLCKAK